MLLRYLRASIAVLLIPLVYAVTKSTLDLTAPIELAGAKAALVWGAVTYLILHLFFIEPTFMYKTPEKVTENIDGFMEPLMKSSPFLLPVYTMLVLVLYFILSKTDIQVAKPVFLYILTFCFVFHILFAVKRLKERFKGAFNPDYLFSLFVVYTIHMMVLVAGITVICPKPHYIQFLDGTKKISSSIYRKASTDLLKKIKGVYGGLTS